MRWRYKFAIGVPSIGAVAVLVAAGPVPTTLGAQASVTNVARAVDRAASAVRPPQGKPAFDATFSGTRLKTAIWDTCYQWAGPKGCTNFGNHWEREWYLSSQVRVSGGAVHLVAQRKRTVGTTKTGARKVYSCRSGMITSFPGFKFKYGFVQVVANIPHSKGLWPALWLGAANNKWPPEVDMLESWGVNKKTGSFYHPVKGSVARATFSPSLTRGWHTYSLSWTSSRLRFYVDRRLVLTVRKNVPHQQMYFLADLAQYMPVRSGDCTGQLTIKSVKIWKA